MTESTRPSPTAGAGVGPGLDPVALVGIRARRRDLSVVLERIEAHLDAHEGYLAFSGGKDSLTVLHLARQVDPDVPVVFFDSGLEYPETYRYVEDFAERWRLNPHVYAARPSALEVLVASGAWDHHAPTLTRPAPGESSAVVGLHEVLITRPAATAHAAHGPGELWGVRAGESRGRAAAYATALRTQTSRCSCQPACAGHRTARARERHGGLIHRRDGTTVFGPI